MPESSGDLKMLLYDTYQAPFSTNPRTFAVCRYGQPSAICSWGRMGQQTRVNNEQNQRASLVQ